MRIFLLSLLIALVFAVPAMADVVDSVDVNLTITEILEFSVNNASPLTCTLDAYSEFDVPLPIGDVNYTLYANEDWQVEGLILDGDADWETPAWTLSVNGVTIDEDLGVPVDTGLAGDELPNANWPVVLTVPWPESAATPECTIELTASLP